MLSLEIRNKLGWLGALFLATCGIPEAILAIYRGHAQGLSWPFLLMWFLGEACILIPIITLKKKYLIFNYTTNLTMATIIIVYKIIGG